MSCAPSAEHSHEDGTTMNGPQAQTGGPYTPCRFPGTGGAGRTTTSEHTASTKSHPFTTSLQSPQNDELPSVPGPTYHF